MMWWGDGWSPAAWGWFTLLHIVWWLLVVIGLAVLVLRGLGNGWRGRHAGGDRALEILRERYARGEISREEYEERKRVLKMR
ncbi:MAG TPA: SHOCT domain-containing protein [Noviherbaspirillum sp.]|nr:SHOCT domain-containing protein [Noviherbaspirillum sp.]